MLKKYMIFILSFVLSLCCTAYADGGNSIIITRTDSNGNYINDSVIEVINSSNGDIIGKFRTSVNGSVIVNNLADDIFIVREIEAPHGNTVSTDIPTVDFSDLTGQVKQVTLKSNVLNNTVKIQVKNLLTDNAISNVSFTLYQGYSEIGSYQTNSNGEITIGNLSGSSYYLINSSVPEGYLKNDDIIMLDFTSSSIYKAVYIEPVQAKVKFINFDINRVYGIFDYKGNEIQSIKITGNSTISDNIPYGTYKIREYPLQADEGYTIEIKQNNAIYNLDIQTYKKSNTLKENIRLNIKNETVKEALAGTSIKHEIFDIDVDSNVVLDKLYIYISVPAGTNIERLFTGRYNADKKYKIFYKTKQYNEYNILAENLNPQQMYEIDLTAARSSGEITDIVFEFEKVESGFKEIERPFIYTYVKDIKNGEKITAYVSLQYVYAGKQADTSSQCKFTVINL